jgi:hypothetical protein
MMVLTVAENSNREDVSVTERAVQVCKIAKQTGWSQRTMSKNLSIPVMTINELLVVGCTPAYTLQVIEDSKLDLSTASESIKKGGEELVRYVADTKMSRDDVRRLSKQDVQDIKSGEPFRQKVREQFTGDSYTAHKEFEDIESCINLVLRTTSAIENLLNRKDKLTNSQLARLKDNLRIHIEYLQATFFTKKII